MRTLCKVDFSMLTKFRLLKAGNGMEQQTTFAHVGTRSWSWRAIKMPQDNRDNDIAGMIKALSSQDPFMQVRAQQQLLQAGKRAVDALVDLVSKQRGRTCLIGIELLTEIGDRRAVPALI